MESSLQSELASIAGKSCDKFIFSTEAGFLPEIEFSSLFCKEG
jgi:hypothetical protein